MAQIKDYQKQADDNRIEIHYDQKDVIVNADKARITQVIANLLRNAINLQREVALSLSLQIQIISK